MLPSYHCRRRQSVENPSNAPPPQGSIRYQDSLLPLALGSSEDHSQRGTAPPEYYDYIIKNWVTASTNNKKSRDKAICPQVESVLDLRWVAVVMLVVALLHQVITNCRYLKWRYVNPNVENVGVRTCTLQTDIYALDKHSPSPGRVPSTLGPVRYYP